ncbi:MAG: alginate lyase family protein, partial [Bythopirellula sp.]
DQLETLALAYYYFGEEKYAKHASLLIRTWFLDPETKMNPNLKYGQAVLGRSEGRGVGIIDTRGFIVLLDCVALVRESPSFSAADEAALREWFGEFLVWLRTSDLGIDEKLHENNHGSWYAAQVARIALFVGNEDFAREVVETVRTERIPNQFKPDGRQPHENERTKSLHYCMFNLSALSVVARVGEQLGLDLWNVQSPGAGSMKQGLNYIRPFLSNQAEWPYQQLDRVRLSPRTIMLLRMASVRYSDPKYEKLIEQTQHRYSDRNYATLVCGTYSGRAQETSTPTVKVSTTEKPRLETYQLPDTSSYTIENIRKLLPSTNKGTAKLVPTREESLLDETFRKQRGADLQRRQGTTETQTIKLSGGALTLSELVEQIDDASIAAQDATTTTIRLPILIASDATLIIDGGVLRLSTDRGALIANAGTLFVLQAEVTSWDEQAGRPTPMKKVEQFRPFISSYIRSKTYLAGSTFANLGFLAPTAYGLSLSSHPERNRGEPNEDWPTGQVVENVFRGMFYGFYSYEARDVAIVGNTYEDSIRYGIDPHDRSTRLIIANNIAKGTRERHGIIGSREVSNSFIFGNKSFENGGSGIMLDRQCTGNVVVENQVYDNGQGIAVYESAQNLIANNTILMNEKSGVRVRNSREIVVQENIVAGNGDYGFEVYSKRLDDHEKRQQRGDHYRQHVAVSIYKNTITGNAGGLIKGNDIDLLRISNVDLQLDEAKLQQVDPKHTGRLERDDDDEFGSQLKPFREQLVKVFDPEKPLVEFQGR